MFSQTINAHYHWKWVHASNTETSIEKEINTCILLILCMHTYIHNIHRFWENLLTYIDGNACLPLEKFKFKEIEASWLPKDVVHRFIIIIIIIIFLFFFYYFGLDDKYPPFKGLSKRQTSTEIHQLWWLTNLLKKFPCPATLKCTQIHEQ